MNNNDGQSGTPLQTQLIFAALCGILIGLAAPPARAALATGIFETLPAAAVEEFGDRVPGRKRIVPWSASLTFDLNAVPPAVTAMIPNAVLEGGEPFALTVRSSSGFQMADGSYRFSGDYLQDIYPTGTQYLFDWRFSTAANGEVIWSGNVGWAGGHAWIVTISNLTVLPRARLRIARSGDTAAQITWDTNLTTHLLEYATSLPATAWTRVTNTATIVGSRFSLCVDADASGRFYRLRRP